MSVPRLFYCTVAGLVVATLLSFLFGASGLLNYHRLQAYERRVATGIAALEERHADLERLAKLLRTEPELLRLLARDSGYYRADEQVIRVGPQTPAAAPFSPYAPDFSDVGPLMQPQLPVPRDPFNVLALGLFLGLGLFTGLTVKRVLRSRVEQADGAAHADGDGGPDAVAGSVEDAFPAAAWADAEPPRGDVSADAGPDGAAAAAAVPAAENDGPLRQADAAEEVAEDVAASGDIGTRSTAGRAPAAGDAGVEPAPRRKRRRGRQRRGEVTVYRL